jgi:hypothetical protein
MTPRLRFLLRGCVSVALLLTASPLAAQTPPRPSPATMAAIDRVGFLEGEWRGSGWIQMGPDRRDFTQTEQVRRLANRSVLFIEGHGVTPGPDGQPLPVHEALAAIHFDATTQRYGMRAWRGDGVAIDARVSISGDTLTWGFSPMAGIDTEYQITRGAAGEWLERGFVMRAGTRTQFFEMRLERVR